MHINSLLSDILPVVKGTCTLDPSFFIERIAALESAGPRDIAVLFDERDTGVFTPISQERVAASKAGVIIVRHAVAIDRPTIVVDDPVEAYQRLVTYFEREHQHERAGVHPTAIVAVGVQLGNNVHIGPYTIIETGTRIGDGTVIDAHCYIGRDCRVGSGVRLFPRVTMLDHCSVGDISIVHSGVVIGSDGYRYMVTKFGMQKIPQIGTVRIGKQVEIGANTTIDRASFDETIIEDGAKIDNLVHIAHNVRVGAHTAIIAQTGIAGGTSIGMGCQIGGQVGIKDHIVIGNGAKVVSKSAVLRDVEAGATVAGMPAMPFGEWKRCVVSLAKLPHILKTIGNIEEFVARMSRKKSWFSRLFSRSN